MALLAGIGRGFTSLGSDMQKNRLEREDREQRFAEREEIRGYNKDLVAEQENRRLAALGEAREFAEGVRQDNRTFNQGVIDDTRTFNQGVRDQSLINQQAAAALADDRAVARAATAAQVAQGVVGAQTEAELEKQRLGAAAYDKMLRAGTRVRGPFAPEFNNQLHPQLTGSDVAQMRGANLTPTVETSYEPTSQMVDAFRLERDNELGIEIPEPQSSFTDAYNRAKIFRNPGSYGPVQRPVPQPTSSLLSQNPLVRSLSQPRSGADIDIPGRSVPAPDADSSMMSGSVVRRTRDSRGQVQRMSQSDIDLLRATGDYTEEQLAEISGSR
jgi:hypothetical protein|tara:strand:+ start:9431 stop:10414 length:984 start_codon:yes stop_codon:yes gene_type:complete